MMMMMKGRKGYGHCFLSLLAQMPRLAIPPLMPTLRPRPTSMPTLNRLLIRVSSPTSPTQAKRSSRPPMLRLGHFLCKLRLATVVVLALVALL